MSRARVMMPFSAEQGARLEELLWVAKTQTDSQDAAPRVLVAVDKSAKGATGRYIFWAHHQWKGKRVG